MREWNALKGNYYDRYVNTEALDPVARIVAGSKLESFASSSNEIGYSIYKKKIEIEQINVLPWHFGVKNAQEKASVAFEDVSDTLTNIKYQDKKIIWKNNELTKPFLEMTSALNEAIPFWDPLEVKDLVENG